MNLTEPNILSLAPDPATGQRARQVAHAPRWFSLDGNERAIWGEHGQRENPYRTAVDFQNGFAFKCSCPVKRLPCKHGIGLLLLFSKNNDAFKVASEMPDWVTEWLSKRDERSGKKKSETPAVSTEEELAKAEKRQQNRQKRLFQMSAGLAELESWLTDLFRQGLVTLEGQASSYWPAIAARMVDAKLGGIARRIRRLPQYMTLPDWHEKILAELGDIYLIVKAFHRIEHLPEPLQDDLLSLVGVNFKKEEVLENEGEKDQWLVAGQTEILEENNLLARRTWFIGEASKRTVLLLEFSWGGQPYETNWRPGTVISGEVAFYPSAFPQRVLFKNFEWTDRVFNLTSGCPTLGAFAKRYAEALSQQPWLSPFPAFLENVVPVFQKEKFVLVDLERKQLPLLADEELGWKMVALSGGRPFSVFGQWDGELFQTLSAVVEGQFRLLATIGNTQ